MKEFVKCFMDTRERIIKNSVLNKLLVAKLNSVYSPIVIGKSLVNINQKGRRLLAEQKGCKAKLPKFAMASIVTSLSFPYQVGYSYSDIRVWTSKLQRPRKGDIAILKSFASQICSIYHLNATSADKIFSKIPDSVIELLKQEGISSSYWRTGVKKEIKDLSQNTISKDEVNKYYSNLQRRLSDWRIFNSILIALVRNDSFKAETNEGTLVVHKTPLDGIIRFEVRYTDHVETLSAIVPYSSLTPDDWDRLDYDIDIFLLRKILG